jgi:hypothetical protein
VTQHNPDRATDRRHGARWARLARPVAIVAAAGAMLIGGIATTESASAATTASTTSAVQQVGGVVNSIMGVRWQ